MRVCPDFLIAKAWRLDVVVSHERNTQLPLLWEAARSSTTSLKKFMTHRTPILALLLIGTLTFQSCNKTPKIDGSSDQAFTKSAESIKASLSEEKKEEFEKAVMAVAFDGANLFEFAADADGARRRMRDRLNGKSADDIIEAAKRIQSERTEAQANQIAGEIRELEQKQAATEQAKESLQAFKIERSRFYFAESGFSTGPVIEISVTNNTSSAVSRAYFRGVLATHGRSVPWVEDDFNYEISGGLEPGESQTWKLSPNMFGAWGKAPKDRNDMVFTATVVRIDGPDGEALIDADFSDGDAKRLRELKAASNQ